jgi:hypothetical protein
MHGTHLGRSADVTQRPHDAADSLTRAREADALEANAQLERLADLVSDRLLGMPLRRLLTVAELAEYLAVDAGFVYERADALGAKRLGDGPKAPLPSSSRRSRSG